MKFDYKKDWLIEDNLVVFDDDVPILSATTNFVDLPKVFPIPSNSIIYKTITGIGATHAEIVAPRSSIIVLPHISVILSKHEHYKDSHNTLAVYQETTDDRIDRYLMLDDGYAKILTTPRGVDKIVRVLARYRQGDLRKYFFFLIDESHKVVQDSDYRDDMLTVMDHFFQFPRRAMISATPIRSTDPRFKIHGFQYIKLKPEFEHSHKIELVHASSVINGLSKYFAENDAEHYCIFFNSIEGINNVVDQLKLNDYQIFCSQESGTILRLNNDRNADWKLKELTKYNFFTSSFFNGLDIKQHRPNIVIVTDYSFRRHTVLDPYADVLQIIGRFRKKENGEPGFNKITHINNALSDVTTLSETEAKDLVILSQSTYNYAKDLKHSALRQHVGVLDQFLATIKPYSTLLDKKGNFSFYLLDNYLDNERVKRFYKSPASLRAAYENTGLYQVVDYPDMYQAERLVRLRKKTLRYSQSANRLLADMLLNLEELKGLDVYYEQRALIAKLSLLITEAYDKLGYDGIKTLRFRKRRIQEALNKLSIQEGVNAFPVINQVYFHFKLDTKYTWAEIKPQLQVIFDEFRIKYRVKASDILRYFEYRLAKKQGQRAFIFTSRCFYPIEGPKHT